ncbi:YdeI/OmpD-associated family protein [Halocatena marina]|uniref:YdeI/OmpD-associated family protein n=1 Tax=Halocatena marina TaxID=2934937 RepID=UPI00200EE262|nr:hypothetical protein [Halocatena marina]
MVLTFFSSPVEFRDWLKENHDTADEVWVGYYKKDADQTDITYGQSVEEAICFS